ncbi:hypothetical protein EVAR_28017_1 [Eumeta japonica]|uniref:Mariner Mos1 transposase n=1 Tax=Eumeta variegata TaxID=151549 RepID=A0A4C1WC39_EUMVA|nr:hypothetical protein EVAR_28017_1 [Eumeta japonica]
MWLLSANSLKKTGISPMRRFDEMRGLYDHGRSNAVYDIVTEDETWLYCYMLERKQQPSVWVFEGHSKPTKSRQAKIVGPEEAVIAFNQHVQNMPSDQRSSCFQK